MNTSIVLFILFAIAGYQFLRRWSGYTRYKTVRQSGYHLFFNSVIVGLLLMGLAMIPAGVISYHTYGRFWPGTAEAIWLTWLFSFSLAMLVPECMRWRNNKKVLVYAVMRAARERGDYRKVLLETAALQSGLVELSLENGKTYIGFVVESGLYSEAEETDISIAPVLSGYRVPNTRKLFISYDYGKVVLPLWDRRRRVEGARNMTGRGTDRNDVPDVWNQDFCIVVPMNKIEIARIVTLEQFKYHVDDELEVIDVPPEEKATGSIRAGPGNA